MRVRGTKGRATTVRATRASGTRGDRGQVAIRAIATAMGSGATAVDIAGAAGVAVVRTNSR